MRSAITIVGGVLMLLSAAAHASGWFGLRADFAAAQTSADLVQTAGAGWLWGSAAMAAFGAITLVGASRWRRGDRSGLTAIAILSCAYVVFGVCAIGVLRTPFFLIFVITGMLAGLPLVGSRPSRPPS